MSALSKRWVKKALSACGLEPGRLAELISTYSISTALSQNGYRMLVQKLRETIPDISDQESSERSTFNKYWELKRRVLQAFQCSLMLKSLECIRSQKLHVVDIGDSAGTHMLYLKSLTTGRFDIDTLSVNLDPRAIEKITRRGLEARLCRAEDLEMEGKQVDLFTSFQMVEHLHNPALFFHRLAKKAPVVKW